MTDGFYRAVREGRLRHLEREVSLLVLMVRRLRELHDADDFCSMSWKARHVTEEAQRIVFAARDVEEEVRR